MIKHILFNTDMVQAILDGRKTMTRRVVKNPAKPPCRKGDILYVRETWCGWYLPHGKWLYRYKATDPNGNRVPTGPEYEDKVETRHWRPSIHMPREAARIWLKVTHVWLERLHDITNDEILKEGASPEAINNYVGQIPEAIIQDRESVAHKIEFSQLWDSTVKKADIYLYGWDANPYVWVIEFERCEKPEEV